MNTHDKVEASGKLAIMRLAGFEIRGFNGFSPTRGEGDKVDALSIRKNGEPVSRAYVGGISRGESYRIVWEQNGKPQEMEVSVMLSDDGSLKICDPADPPEIPKDFGTNFEPHARSST